MAYACKILADSISPAGHRITSFECTFPRIVLAEVNTHCMLARNSASSRAMPVAGRIAAVKADPFVPESFGRNRKGMQPGEALEGAEAEQALGRWFFAWKQSMENAQVLSEIGVHKQYANRLLEPFSWHTAVISGTDFDNFFNLRVNPLAQGEFQTIARMMQEARAASEPRPINYGEWHLPYVSPGEAFDLEVQKIDVAAVSVARCARVSYLTQNGVRDVSEDLAFYERLVEAGHMSPLEHVARPMTLDELELVKAYDVTFVAGPTLRVGVHVWDNDIDVEKMASTRGPLHYSGKLNGWISRRAHVPGEYDILGHRQAG